MFKFGGEKYSRESFDKAHEAERTEYNKARYMGTLDHIRDPEARSMMYQSAWKAHEKAEKKLKKILESGRSEAVSLNEEYEKLMREADEAVARLETFKVEKLGIDGRDTEDAEE